MIYKRLVFILFLIQCVFARFFDLPEYFNPASYTREVAKNVFIQDCSDNQFALKIKSIKISPEVVVAGGELTIEATGTLERPVVDGAVADVLVKLGVVKLLHKKFDICKELDDHKEDVQIQCPIEKGLHTVVQKITLPKEVPKAKFIVDVRAYFDEVDGEPLACLKIVADFRVHKFERQKALLLLDDMF